MAKTFRVARNPDSESTRLADVFRLSHVSPSMVAELLAQAQVRYPQVPIVFCETRALAQEYAYRFLGAAMAYADEDSRSDLTGFGRAHRPLRGGAGTLPSRACAT